MDKNRFIDNKNGTVTDTSAGLVWQQARGEKMTWEKALSYCKNLSLGGRNNWRLPDVSELQSLVDYARHDPAIDADFFPGTMSSYWTSVINISRPNFTWCIYFSDGRINDSGKHFIHYIRAVRSDGAGDAPKP